VLTTVPSRSESASSSCKPPDPLFLNTTTTNNSTNPLPSLSFLGLLIYASIVFHQYRRGSLRGTYAKANSPEGHNLVANTGYPHNPQQAYAHDYPKTAYYDAQAVSQAQAYGGQGYPAAPQAYEPFTHRDQPTETTGVTGQAYEMNQRSAV
jgi:hypothetical protein